MTRLSLGERAFRWLSSLLPSDFRGDFGADIVATLAGRPHVRWWTQEIPGLLAAILREHTESLITDTRYAVRQLLHTPGFTVAAVVMLAAGTGANAAVFSVIDAAIIRPGFPDPDRLSLIAKVRPDGTKAFSLTFAELDAVAHLPVFDAVSPVTGRFTVADLSGDRRRLLVECVSNTMTTVTGVHPAIGRSFTEAEDREAARVVVLSHALWQSGFGGRRDALGDSLLIDGVRFTVIGVMPRGYLGANVQSETEAWAPFGPPNGGRLVNACAGSTVRASSNVYARIGRAFTATSAAAAIDAAHVLNGRADLTPSYRSSYDSFRGPLLALGGVVLCVLLIACANVANLQLERIAGRRRDIAVRFALGASRFRIVRQSVIENGIIALAGVAGGLVAARATLRAIAALMPPTMPNVDDLAINGRVLGVAIGATLIGALLVGLLPALHVTRAAPDAQVPLGSRGMAGGSRWTRRSLVVLEVALSVALLIGAGLMVRTLWALEAGELGFATSQRYTARALLEGGWMPSEAHRAFVSTSLAELNAIPGVRRASASSYLPLSGYTARATLTTSDASPATTAWTGATSPYFLEDIGATFLAGRGFNDADAVGAPSVAVVNETLARQLFPAGAVGRQIQMKSELDDRPSPAIARTIVGVIRDLRQGGRDRIQRPEIYVPYAQESGPALLYYVLVTDGPVAATLPAGIKEAFRRTRPGQTVERIESLDATVTRAFARPRFGAWLFAAFAGLALLLAALGIAAVVAWWVRERRREIAVRAALGARPRDAVRLILTEAMLLCGTGSAIGALVAFGGTRLLREWLYGVTPTDWPTFTLAIAGLLLVAMMAAAMPARHAARIDPAEVLRDE